MTTKEKAKVHAIIEQVDKVFMRLGVRSVNMDDLARHLRMSKKTLYRHFKDKDDLVSRIVKYKCDHITEHIHGICDRGLNAIDESFEITRFVSAQVAQMHPSIHFDLQKYHPKAFDLLIRTEQANIYECITQNMQKGIDEGLYRKDLNIPMIAKIYIARFDVTFDGELFPPTEFDLGEVSWELFRYHIRGIASEKGVKYLTQKVKKERSK